MANFRRVDRNTGFLLSPPVDEWLPERHLARFVAEVIDSLDLRNMRGVSWLWLGLLSSDDAAWQSGLWLCDGSGFDPQAGARDV